MSMHERLESEVLESVLPRYEAEGFDVFVHPSPSILPPFLQKYRPDAIAIGPEKKIAIEVMQSTPGSELRARELELAFAEHKDWELRIFYVSPRSSEKTLASISRSEIEAAIQQIESLLGAKQTQPALIMCWAALEAIGRALLFENLKKPQTPARLVEVLASEGYIAPREADFLRALIQLRNSAVHGQFDVSVEAEQISKFVSVLHALANLVPESASRRG